MKKLLLLLTLLPTLCFAGGRAELQWDGSYRFTDDFGVTTGYAQPQWNGDYRFRAEQPQYLLSYKTAVATKLTNPRDHGANRLVCGSVHTQPLPFLATAGSHPISTSYQGDSFRV